MNTDLTIGGLGGECYRNYLIGPWTPEQERMWEVVAETVQIQEEESKAGAVCSDIAARIHQHQVDAGMAEFIYHRPAHGQGQFFAGHQPPFIALGDHTVLEENMTFSMEPGLYDSTGGNRNQPQRQPPGDRLEGRPVLRRAIYERVELP